MKYIVAKKLNSIGCYAFRVKDRDIVELIDYLIAETIEKEVEVFIISSPEAYREYEPYKIIENKKEFINRVLDLWELEQ
ncbi:hypothetical protein QYB63_001214 [Clostridium perfringens]|nr:hypothetical protein [Clostridium perfringens]